MPTEDEILQHYGVRGMKWGKRSAGTRGGTPPSSRSAGDPSPRQQKRTAKKEARAKRTSDILAARERQAKREREYEEAQGEFMAARTNKGTAKAEKIMRQKERDLFVNDDLKKSQEWTTGEAATFAVIAAIGFAGAVFAPALVNTR